LTAGFALPVEEFALADPAGAVAAGVGFAVVTALYAAGAGGLATQPNNISRVTWTANDAFTDSHMRPPSYGRRYTAIGVSIIFGIKQFVTGTTPEISDVSLVAARG
jgi:hypothetical protein